MRINNQPLSSTSYGFRAPNSPGMDEPTAGEESAASFLEMAFRSIENRTNGTNMNGNDADDHGQSGYISFQQDKVSAHS